MPSRPPFRLRRAPLFLNTNLLRHASTLLLSASFTCAQIIHFARETTSILPSSFIPTTLDTSPSATTSTDSRSQTTLFSPISAHNATARNASTTSTDRGSLPLGPANGDPMQPGEQPPTGSGLLNYYFAFLAVFVVLLFLGAWYIHRRKKRMKALRASSRQNALSRDLDAWAGGRRWVGGAFRGGPRRQQERERQSSEEGLNELGEAPPPYKARDSVVSREGAAPSSQGTETAHEGESPQTTIPLRTFRREGHGSNRPPDYHETVRELPEDTPEPSAAAQRHAFARTNTSDHASSSG